MSGPNLKLGQSFQKFSRRPPPVMSWQQQQPELHRPGKRSQLGAYWGLTVVAGVSSTRTPFDHSRCRSSRPIAEAEEV